MTGCECGELGPPGPLDCRACAPRTATNARSAKFLLRDALRAFLSAGFLGMHKARTKVGSTKRR